MPRKDDKNMASLSEKRRAAREQAFIILFEMSFNTELTIDEIIQIAIETEVVKEDKFTLQIVRTAAEKLAEVDSQIEKNLKGWSMARISKVSLALLRMAITEILYFEDIPAGASINEAVEICKIYGSDEDRSFINGVLGSVSRGTEA